MSELLTRIKQELLDEYEATGRIDREGWLARYPQFHEDLLLVFRLFDAADAAEAVPAAEPWSDYQGIVGRARQNVLRIAEIHEADPEEAALGQALAAVRGPLLRPPHGKGAVDERILRVFTLGLVVQALVRARARLHQFMGQKLSDLAEAGLRLGLWGHAPYAFGMFDKGLYRVEQEAERRGWLQVKEKKYVPLPLLESELKRLGAEILSHPDLTRRYLDHLARRDSMELEVWGMTRYAAAELVTRGERITVSGVLRVFRETPEWGYKVGLDPDLPEAMITEVEVEQALEHLIRLRLVPVHEVDLVT